MVLGRFSDRGSLWDDQYFISFVQCLYEANKFAREDNDVND